MPVPGHKVVLWMLLAVLVGLVGVDGGLRLARIQLMEAQFERFGFDLAWLRPLGAVEVAGALLLLAARTRLAAAILLSAVMLAGVFAYLATGAGRPALPTTIFVLLLGLIWIHFDQRGDRPGQNSKRSRAVPDL